jgi:hypothetical protein
MPAREMTTMSNGPMEKIMEKDREAASLNTLSLLKSTPARLMAFQNVDNLNHFIPFYIGKTMPVRTPILQMAETVELIPHFIRFKAIFTV